MKQVLLSLVGILVILGIVSGLVAFPCVIFSGAVDAATLFRFGVVLIGLPGLAFYAALVHRRRQPLLTRDALDIGVPLFRHMLRARIVSADSSLAPASPARRTCCSGSGASTPSPVRWPRRSTR